MARRRNTPLVRIGAVLILAALVVGAADALGGLNLLEKMLGGLVAQAAARRVADAVADSRWALALLALGLACIALGALRATGGGGRRSRRSGGARPRHRSGARRRPGGPRRKPRARRSPRR